MKRRIIGLSLFFAALTQSAAAQQLLTLDSCRAMALRNNKQMGVSRVKQEVAANLRKSARTKYLPHVSALGGYEWTSKEISLLSDDQKKALSNMGTSLTTAVGPDIPAALSMLPQDMVSQLVQSGLTPGSSSNSCCQALPMP